MSTLTFDIGERSGWEMTVRDTIKLSTTTCDSCGMVYAIPTKMMERARELGQSKITWYCPNGHRGIGFHGKSEEERLRERLGAERRHSGRLAAERDQAEARRRSQKGATTRARKRHAAGVCPACNRTFKQLTRHMESQHPDFDPASPVSAGGGQGEPE